MYRQILTFTITILFFILGIGYLLIYTLKLGVTRERERQDKVYGQHSTQSSISSNNQAKKTSTSEDCIGQSP
jgi:uncharacterized membrane protein